MKRSKKLILVAVLAAVILVGSIGGVVLAQTGTGTPGTSLLDRVAAKLGIEPQKLQDAFTQAQKEMRDEALTNRLNDLVKQGKMTQEQADQYKNWVNSKPNVPLPGFGGPKGHMGFRGFGGFPGPKVAPTPTPTPSS